MTEPTAGAKAKGEVLSVGAKTYIREMARSAIFGVEKQLNSKVIEKGLRVEEDSIALYNSVFFTNLQKNTERRTVDGLTGECDLWIPNVKGIDIKSSWSIDTFPLIEIDAQEGMYEWQARGYMKLWNLPEWQIAYCLVDTPEDLIGFEAEESHIVGHIAEELRVTTWTIKRDMDLEASIAERIRHAREYYRYVLTEFDRTHGGDGSDEEPEPPPWGDSSAPPPKLAPALLDLDAITF